MSSSTLKKYFNFVYYFIFLVVFALVIFKPLEISPDSESYLDMSINRYPVYPIFLKLVKTLFVNKFSFFLKAFQFIIGAISIHYMVRTIRNLYKLDAIWILLLTLVLLIPYFYEHHIANKILSEAVAYPLYLFNVSLIITYFITEKKKLLITILPLLIILILTRGQFLFLTGVIILLLLYLSYKSKKLIKNLGFIALFLVVPLITSALDSLYHYIKHDHYTTTPWTGIHLITPPLYVANQHDEALFNDPKEKAFFRSIHNRLREKSLNINHLESEIANPYQHYITYYGHITNFTLYDYGKNLLENNLTDNEKYLALDNITKSIYYPLVKNNLKSWVKVYIYNFINAFKDIKHLSIIFLLLFFGFIKLNTKDHKAKLIVVGCLLLIMNAATVAIGVHTISRLIFYNDWVLFLIIFLLLNSLIKTNLPNLNKPNDN